MQLPEGIWRRAIETLPSEIALLDADGTIVYTNQQWQSFGRENGLAGDEAASLGQNYLAVTESTDDEYADRTLAGLREVLVGERSQFTVEYPCHSPDEQRWFRLLAQPLAVDGDRFVVLEHLNITDRKLVELAVQEKNERLEALHEAAQRLLQVESRSEAAELAVTVLEEVLEMPIVGLWLYDPERDSLEPAATTAEAEAVIGEHPSFTDENSLSWKAYVEGETFVFDEPAEAPVLFNPESPIRSEIVLPLGRYGVLNTGATETHAFDEVDATLAEIWAVTVANVLDRVDREQELRTRERELTRERDRLEQFASLVSHDLRNPLNVATGRLALATEECESEHLEPLERALDRMERLVEDLLVLAREGEAVGETEPVRVGALAESCWSTVETHGATLAVESDLTIRADESRLAQVFENLYRNAVEHGGDDVRIRVGDLADGTGFFVADDGPGIPPDERAQVFENGYSTSTDGTGFGLAIVDQIVAAHGWSVGLAEGADGGARFEFTDVDVVDG